MLELPAGEAHHLLKVLRGGSGDRLEVVDATGAGDAFAAGFLLGGYEMALRAGARCVGQMGAMPR